MSLLFQIILFAVQVLIAFFVGEIAKDKGRNFTPWFIFGLFTSVWALFYVMLVDDLRPPFPVRRRKVAGGKVSLKADCR